MFHINVVSITRALVDLGTGVDAVTSKLLYVYFRRLVSEQHPELPVAHPESAGESGDQLVKRKLGKSDVCFRMILLMMNMFGVHCFLSSLFWDFMLNVHDLGPLDFRCFIPHPEVQFFFNRSGA